MMTPDNIKVIIEHVGLETRVELNLPNDQNSIFAAVITALRVFGYSREDIVLATERYFSEN